MLNRIILMGRLTRDPELRYTRTNTPVASLTLAVERDFKGRDSGERVTDFIDVTVWRNTAEFVRKYFRKGQMAVVEGRLQTETWTDERNEKRKSYKVVADSIYFGDSKKDGDNKTGDSKPSAKPSEDEQYSAWAAAQQQNEQFAELTGNDDDLPF